DGVDVAAGGGDDEGPALVLRRCVVVEGEVAEAVVDVGRAEVATAEEDVGVGADDGVGAGADLLHLGHQGGDVVGGGQPGLGGGGRPRRGQVGVDDLGGHHDGDALPLDGGLVRGEGLCDVLADPHDGEPGLCADGDGLLEAGGAAVHAVVVGLGDQVDPGVLQGC